jgi:two-component system invasion response regulator UvrY
LSLAAGLRPSAPREAGAVRVAIVDDHNLLRAGLRKILAQDPTIEVVGEAASGEEALALLRRLPVEVVLLDLHMPGLGGLETVRRLRRQCQDVRVVVLSVSYQEPYLSAVLEAGAHGFLSKDCAAEEVVDAVHAVLSDTLYLSADIARLYVGAGRQRPPGACPRLSHRELQVLELWGQGMGTQDIAERLHLSTTTVRTYRHRLCHKLGACNSAELLRAAVLTGLLPGEATAIPSED